jgi:hypothetical protein
MLHDLLVKIIISVKRLEFKVKSRILIPSTAIKYILLQRTGYFPIKKKSRLETHLGPLFEKPNSESKLSATLLRLSPLQADGALRLRKNIDCLYEQGTLRPKTALCSKLRGILLRE